jgi:hypothetical protein
MMIFFLIKNLTFKKLMVYDEHHFYQVNTISTMNKDGVEKEVI